jgi:hypothetical protein
MKWVAFALVFTLLFSTITYGGQEANAINPIKGYVSSGGTGGAVVEVEIGENGTKTVSPETPEDDDHEKETVKETVKEKPKEEIKTTEETTKPTTTKPEVKSENATSTEEKVCKSTACMLKKRHEAEIKAWEEQQKAKQSGTEIKSENVTNATSTEEVCLNTACFMKKKQLEEQLKAGINIGDCTDTSCLKKLLLEQTEKVKEKPLFTQKIITLSLSNGCIQAHKNNITTICPTYEDLIQFDNTDQLISGEFVTENGFYHRADSKFKKHCNYYNNPQLFPLVLVVDPDDCWNRERGAFTVTINAIATDDFKFKIKDSYNVDKLRQMQNQDTRIITEESTHRATIDRIEKLMEDRAEEKEKINDKLKDFDEETRKIFEEIGQNADLTSKRAEERKLIEKQLNSKAWTKEEAKWNVDITEAKKKYDEIIAEKKIHRAEQIAIKGKSSESVVNGTLVFGVGRSFEECRHAKVGSDLQLITDTMNYMINNCEGDVNDKVTTVLPVTPVDYSQHRWYNYKSWLDKMSKECVGICKEY